MATVGYATLQIIPSMRGAQGTIAKELGGMTGAGDAAGKSIGSRMAGGLTKTLKGGAVAAGGAITAVLGTSLVKGFGRLRAIDEAEAKLRGLGYEATEVTGIMDNVSGAVTGTAFGLDEAATAAASALSAGIEPGKELTDYLALIGDAATQGGASFNEMAAIINKTTATGKVGMENLNQLSERGIGVMGWLADEYGVTGAELSKMVSAGEVDTATLQKVLQDRIGGAAQESGKTFTGALANMGAALGRLGAKVLGGVFAQMPTIFTRVSTSLDALGPAAEAVGVAMGAGLAAIGPLVADAFGEISALASSIDLTGVAAAIVPVLQTVADLVTGTLLPTLSALAGYLFDQLAPIVISVGQIFTQQWLPMFAEVAGFMYGTLYPALMGIVGAIAQNLRPVFEALVSVVRGTILPAFSELLAKLREWWPTIQQVITVVTVLGGALAKIASTVLGALLPPIIKLAAFFARVLFKSIIVVIDVIVAVIRVIMGLVGVLRTVWNAVGRFDAIMSAAFERVRGAITSAVDAIRRAVIGAWNAIRRQTAKIFGAIPGLIGGALGKARGAAAAAVRAIGRAITGGWNAARNATSKAWAAMTNGVSNGVNRAVGLVRSLPGKLGNVTSAFVKAGRNLADAVWRGLKNGFSTGAGFLSDILNSIRAGLNDVLGLPKRVGGKRFGFTIPGFARGTNNYPGGLGLVGEEGPELVSLPRGSKIYTAAETRAMSATPTISAVPEPGGSPRTMILRVGQRDFVAYLEQIADGRVASAVDLATERSRAAW